ncbi:uncharacterized protein PG998_007152 [Apiospora kogelbergensis]|uniref:uncharacterized protein n=1 Tax=Apiospora kogelbergensis TaxID=1337665 RepID=UPI0031314D7A
MQCPEVEAAPTWMQRDDVSGNKKGIRIVGSDILSPQIFEANVQHVHFTIYEDRDYQIFDTDGNEHGFCQPPTALRSFVVTRTI